MPTLAQLKANFAVLRRPQTAADRSWQPPRTAAPGLTRLAQRLPARSGSALAYPVRLFITVEHHRAPTHAHQAPASYRLDLYAVASNGNVAHVPFAPDVDYDVFPLDVLQRYGGGWMLWAGVVPDGVSRVRWQFGCSPDTKGCLKPVHWNVDIPVRDNTAAAAVADTGPCDVCGQPQAVTWYGADGRMVASYNLPTKHNLTAPPFLKTNPTAPLPATIAIRRVLAGNGIAAAHFGHSPAHVRDVIDQLLGQPGSRYTPQRGCGLDHIIVWPSPQTQPPTTTLTAFFFRSRFVGYSYGQYAARAALPAQGIALATVRGLKIGDTLAHGQELYGRAFALSAAQGGTWSAHTTTGKIDGFAFANPKPKHGDVSHRSLVTTIDAGDVGCAALSP